MNWVLLALAGLLEVVWALGLKQSFGFTRPLPSAITVVAMIASLYLLSLALKTLPLSTAYAMWVGIGAIGTVVASVLLLGESLSPLKLLSIGFVAIGIVGLKFAAAT